MKDMDQQGGCGGHCACAAKKEPMTCATDRPVTLDANGKCPCGKPAADCCHKDKLAKGEQNAALDELCGAHAGKHVC